MVRGVSTPTPVLMPGSVVDWKAGAARLALVGLAPDLIGIEGCIGGEQGGVSRGLVRTNRNGYRQTNVAGEHGTNPGCLA